MFRFALALVATTLLSQVSSAGLITYTDATDTGFVANSASNTPTFLAAIGVPTEFLSFQVDKFGNPAPDGPISGTAFSNIVTFSSAVSSIGFGGSNSPLVNATGPTIFSEIGPVSGFIGTLVIDFLVNGQSAGIVGFGPVEFGTTEQIRVYDQNNILVGTFAGLSDRFSFFGVQGTNGTRIGRIELDGNFFAIQDFQFNLASTSAVPEPATLAVFGGITMASLLRYRRRKATATA